MPIKKEITFFAETTFRRQRKKVGIKIDDRRRHVYVVGKTGMGKTAMLENMIIQDIKNGHGVGVIDPHGELAEKILDLIPSNRINDVVYVNPSDIDHPFSFNVMERIGEVHHHLIASGLMDVFKKIWPDVWSSRMEYILENSILALLEFPDSTLLGVNRLLSDKDFRKKVVDNIQDTVVKSYWVNEFAGYSPRFRSEATASIQNKIGQLISNPLIRNIVGQVRSKINMKEIMNNRKILIANLSKGRIGEENSKLLGALLITKLQLAAMSRVDIPESERRDFFLYVDEFQNFATESFASVLSEARKYRLGLTLANQYLAQLTEMTSSGGRSSKVRDAVFGNVGTLITFRVGAEDAEFLEKEFAPEIFAQDLVDLGKYNIYIRLMVDGITGRPFSAETDPPPQILKKSNKDKIVRRSREEYCVDREIIEEKIKRWSGFSKKEEEEKALHATKCSMCKKETKVNFIPDGVRPIYCKDCFKKIKSREQTIKKTEVEDKVQVKPVEKEVVVKVEQKVEKIAPRIIKEEKTEEVKEEVKVEKKVVEEHVVPSTSSKNEKNIESIKQDSVSLKDIKKKDPLLEKEQRHKRKEINVSDLKKALSKALEKKNEQ